MKNSILLEIAKDAIKSQFDSDNLYKEELLKKYPKLQENRATFVTLTIDGNLRGCVGSLIAHRTLLDDLIQNAKAAAFEDSRFAPLSKEEFQKIHIEISLLSTPKKLLYETKEDLKDKIKQGIDGVILKEGFNQATFLPQVWEQLPSFELFFAHLCQKAGMGEKCLENHPEIFVYQVKKI